MTMMVSRRALLGGFALGGAGLMLPGAALAWKADGGAAYPATAAFIEGFVDRRELAGTLAAIGKGQGALDVFGAGTQAMDSARAVDGDTIWRLYSMTKPVTGIAAMILIEDGKLKLDQPIADILPAFAKMKVQNTPDGSLTDVRDAKTLITVRHLLTHTAGLGYGIVQKGPLRDAYNEQGILGGQVSRLPIPGLPASKPAPSLAEFADRLAKLPLVHEPGTQWSYSVGLDLLGRVIEVVSGQPFDLFLKTRLFDPLGMKSTGFQVAAADVGRLSTNYAPFGGALLPIDPATSSIYLDKPPIPYGGGGLVSTARDYDRFLAMLLGEGETDGVRILKPETARLAMSNLLPAGASTKNSFVEGEGFGAGGRVSLPTSPTGEGVFGWGGAAGTIGFVDRKRGCRVGGYAQYMPAEALPFQRDFGKNFYKDVMA
ncbi:MULTISPECIES: serine hydrolase domain-containing protein [unclassified Sphingopyxis]|jgi:CubicO group peptidase (beta-lactamase class C family)|uniref:serine hydrolase domain-containing protein n=1 Tax=unclassified Sphingopyxis TaxID=2614943 RepID=UPI000731CF85|nr:MULTISPECIES: serine hydrolase domain-containing protein [unclassified Sphingopyxis]KTE21588.1 serine hydrolase [Sphingopyxis sp. H057]KTE49585.1 serine hydrolase [Sphingopyxis sp. H073]KTE49756.1 serine hydrolase [Sphingopyxis sp. H071]KTE58212.1 serine hydrolase [Sphingopyxis sp. H107]KTE62640.1 serine hydrolase [Sphingopyxis sp. H100]